MKCSIHKSIHIYIYVYLVIESKSEMPMKQGGLTGGMDGREKACVWDVYWVWWMYSKYFICLHAKDLM